MGVAAAVVGSTILGIGASAHAANKAKEDAKRQSKKIAKQEEKTLQALRDDEAKAKAEAEEQAREHASLAGARHDTGASVRLGRNATPIDGTKVAAVAPVSNTAKPVAPTASTVGTGGGKVTPVSKTSAAGAVIPKTRVQGVNEIWKTGLYMDPDGDYRPINQPAMRMDPDGDYRPVNAPAPARKNAGMWDAMAAKWRRKQAKKAAKKRK